LRTIKVHLFIAFIVAVSIGCRQETGPNFLEGQEIYKTYCVACHGVKGGGVLYNKSALNYDDFVTGDPKEVIAVILYGREGAGTMPGWKMTLNDQKVAEVATYIRQAWSNRADPVTAAMVTEVRTKREKSFSTNPIQ
jgi:alcohol dehydrogenase (quinone), cytochrome c subunit